MLFNSYPFIFAFLPVALAGFFVLGRFGRRFAAPWLVLTSFVFYGFWNPRVVPLLLGSIAFNFTMGEAIHACAAHPVRQRLLLAIGLCGNLSLLIYYKYFAAMSGLFMGLGLIDTRISPMVLPLGISFFTFTQ